MNDLLQLAVDAHGGLDRWNSFDKVAVHILVSGVLWHAKGQDGVLSDTRIEVELRKQRGRYIDFDSKAGQETYFSPGRVAIVDKGHVVEELINPRDSFSGHTIETPWTKLQLVYFGSYAMWEYLNIPFNFTLPGFQTKEIDPWHEREETWRRLQVHFPGDLAYHSKEQVFYFDEKGLLKRLDYHVDISGNAPAAQYVFDYREFQGIKLPTRRLVYRRDEHDQLIQDPLLVGIEVLDVQFK
jgi:hypothetical protein